MTRCTQSKILTVLREGVRQSTRSHFFNLMSVGLDSELMQVHSGESEEKSLAEAKVSLMGFGCTPMMHVQDGSKNLSYRMYCRHNRANVDVPSTGSILKVDGMRNEKDRERVSNQHPCRERRT